MKEIQFRELMQSASPTHKPAAGYLAKLMDETGITLHQVSRMSDERLEIALEDIGLKKPDMWARKIKKAINHIAENHPAEDIPTCEITPSHLHKLPSMRTQPHQFRLDVVAIWRSWKAQRRDPNADLAPPVEPVSFYTGIRKCRTYLATLERATGAAIGPTFGIEAMTHPELAQMTFKQMKAEHYTKKTISSTVYQLISVLRGLHEDEDEQEHEHAHLKWLISWAAKEYPTKELSAEEVMVIRRLLAEGGLSLLHGAPERIAREAKAPHLGPKDRVARLSYAVALALKVDHLGLTEQDAVRLDLDDDIVKMEEGACLRLNNAGLKGGCRLERLTERSITLIEDLRLEKKKSGYKNSLLFAPRDKIKLEKAANGDEIDRSSFRSVSSVMNRLYSEVEHATGIRTTFVGIKDLFVTAWLDKGISSFVVAERAGYEHERSVRLRHAYFFVSEPSSDGSKHQP